RGPKKPGDFDMQRHEPILGGPRMTEHAALTKTSPEARILGSSETRVFGLGAVERLERLFAAKGIAASPYREGEAPAAPSVIGVLGDHVYEPVLIVNLMEQEGMLLCL